AGLLVIFSLLVVLAPNLVHAAIALVASFFMTAGLYLLLRMEFVAIAQVLVYIGGVVIFVVITILLTTRLGDRHVPPTPRQRLWGLLIAGALLALPLTYLDPTLLPNPRATPLSAEAGGLTAIGTRLLQPSAGGFLAPFELISLLLLIALIGAVVIARKHPPSRRDNP
ncbi:MAG: hypothetical protein COZ12_07355, partial [Deltaproteobacteria bacterium CG_4_10_14_3_um_filter_60_8]